MSYSLSLERFVGKIAVVTGASAGVGKSITELLVKQGIIVAGIARRLDRLNNLAKELSGEKGTLHAFQCDLTKQDQIFSTFKKITTELGPIHILVNNAGLALATNVIDGDIEKWKTILDTNVLALAICAREAIASMKAHNIKGHIININSGLGHFVPDLPGLSVYPASKYAVTALTETIRLEINREKSPIKITSLSPGVIQTEFAEVALGGATSEQFKRIAEQFKNIPRLQAQDVADATLYILATPEHVNVKELMVNVLEGV